MLAQQLPQHRHGCREVESDHPGEQLNLGLEPLNLRLQVVLGGQILNGGRAQRLGVCLRRLPVDPGGFELFHVLQRVNGHGVGIIPPVAKAAKRRGRSRARHVTLAVGTTFA